MKRVSPTHYVLSVCAAAVLAGCGGSIFPSDQPSGTSRLAVHDASCQGHRSFKYIGHAEHFTVPKCVTTIYVDADGASGKSGADGGAVSATIPVTPGETLTVTVGGAAHGLRGGFNGGGGGGGDKKDHGFGGGGASDIRENGKTLAQRVVVAGGGGGGGAGGTGGGLTGGNGGIPPCNSGSPIGGGGGTQSSGGSGGAGSNGGALGNGGAGVGGCALIGVGEQIDFASGGGGGGYYGGGGGGTGGDGGGGSGYAEPSATNPSMQTGANSGNGSVHICWGYTNAECGSHQRL